MNSNDLPTPYELARIAAALRGRAAEKKPVEAAKQAFALWQSAESVLLEEKVKFQAQETINNVVRQIATKIVAKIKGKDEKPRDLAKNPDDEEIVIRTTDNQSPAMDWFNSNVKNKDHKFASPRDFYDAWVECHGDDAYPFAKNITGEVRRTIGDVRRLLAYWGKKCRAVEAARKRDGRAKKKAGGKGDPKTVPSK